MAFLPLPEGCLRLYTTKVFERNIDVEASKTVLEFDDGNLRTRDDGGIDGDAYRLKPPRRLPEGFLEDLLINRSFPDWWTST